MPALALIFHLIDVADGKDSGFITERCTAAWCECLEAHARRVYESSLDLSYQAARKLARKIQAGEESFEQNLKNTLQLIPEIPEKDVPDVFDVFEERCAIVEYDGGLSPFEAQKIAYQETISHVLLLMQRSFNESIA